jgi:hypothetical protein
VRLNTSAIMKFFAFALSLLVFFSCSKQESSNTDGQSEFDSVSTTTYTPPPPPPDAKPVKLTPEEVQKAAWNVFLQLHFMAIYDATVVGYKEEFAMIGDRITYKVLRHNVDNAGWQVSESQIAYSMSEDPNYTESDDSEGDGSADESDKDDDSDEEVSHYTPTYYTRRDVQGYNNEIDTLIIDVQYIAYLERGEPESSTKTVRIVLQGGLNFANHKDVEMDENYIAAPYDMPVADVVVDFSNSQPIISDEIYLKAKVANLTDQELAGLSKDDLGYTRNEIFARHGHTFKTPKMMEHFRDMEWYHVLIDDAAPLLNKFEKRNVEFIKKKEG